ncbi:hypothetical protein [Nonomuraea sp. NPDC002799]
MLSMVRADAPRHSLNGGRRKPAMTSAGQISGLRPRVRPGDGGDVPGADVDLVDALDPATWRVVTGWLREDVSTTTRQARLQALASFLRWLQATRPALDPLAVTGTHLDAYCADALSGAAAVGTRTPGKPLAKATVARRRAAVSSFYAFAWNGGAVRSPHDTRSLTMDERRLLRRGVAHLAADGRQAEALAVALLEATGTSVGALAALTPESVHAVGDQAAVITLRDHRGDLVAFPAPPPVVPLLRTLCRSRSAGEPLIRRDDGRIVDLEWAGDALADAALAAGIPQRRAKLLHPGLLRAATVTELLHDGPAAAGE